ncbi:MAG TPA: transposase [Pyrinomonadaceae bacterium]|nr:transposase [Pyrinomonadaceae bacterium]
MKLFKSNEPNTFHYVTLVTYNRVPIFKSERACEIFVDVLGEVRQRFPYKLIGYVLMPDHVHAIINTQTANISQWLHKVRGNSAKRILAWLREDRHLLSLKKLALNPPQKRRHTHAVWQKDPSVIDLWSPKFIRQKLNYLHLNPVRAGLCNHPADWKWSSFRAYLPHKQGDVPIEIDWQGYWKDEELTAKAGGQ